MRDSKSHFRELYEKYHVMAYNVALHYVQNIEDAEEIAQDVFVKVHASLQKFRGDSHEKTWIYRIAINTSLDFIKKKKTKRNVFIFGKRDEIANHNEGHFEHPGVLLENKERSKILFDAINALPENQKTAFILARLDGLGNIEISEIMQLSVSSVESLLSRAKAGLREKLSGRFDEYRRKK